MTVVASTTIAQTSFEPSKRERLFRFLWIFGLAVIGLNLGRTLGLGNINWFERSIILVAAIVYLAGKPLSFFSLACVSAMFICTTLLGAFTDFYGFDWFRYINATGALASLLLFFCARPTDFERAVVLKSIAWFPIAIVAVSAVLIGGFGGSLFRADHTGAKRLVTLLIPATLAAACYASCIAAAYLSVSEPKRLRRIYMGLAFLTLLIGLLTGTRMPTAASTLAVGAVLFFSFRSAGPKLGFAFYGALALVGVSLTVGEQLLLRFQSGSMSGRQYLWDMLLLWHERHPWVGIGYGHHIYAIPEHVFKLTGSKAAHNEYLRLLSELGYIGTPAFLICIYGILLSKIAEMPREHIPAYISVLVSFAIYSVTDNTFFVHFCLFALLANYFGSIKGIKANNTT